MTGSGAGSGAGAGVGAGVGAGAGSGAGSAQPLRTNVPTSKTVNIIKKIFFIFSSSLASNGNNLPHVDESLHLSPPFRVTRAYYSKFFITSRSISTPLSMYSLVIVKGGIKRTTVP